MKTIEEQIQAIVASLPETKVCSRLIELIRENQKELELEKEITAPVKTDSTRLDHLEMLFKSVGSPILYFNDDPDIDCDDSDNGLLPVGFTVGYGDACETGKVFTSETIRGAIDLMIQDYEAKESENE